MGFDFSSLFGGLKSNNAFSSINFSDYSLIKSGSYKKLMKSYYGQDKKTSANTSKTDKTVDKQKLDVTDKTGLTKMKTEAEGLKAATEALDKADIWKQTDADKEKIVSAVKKFASEYNDVLAQAAKVSSKDVSQQVGFMTSMSKTMSTALSKVGVTIGDDGKMSVDEEALKKAETKDVKSLFSGSYSYASQIERNASAIASAAARNSSLYSSNGTFSSYSSGKFNEWI